MRWKLAALIPLLTVGYLSGQTVEPHARIIAQPISKSLGAGSPVEVRVQIENVGNTPFFVRRHLSIDDPWAGIKVRFAHAPKAAKILAWGESEQPWVNYGPMDAAKGECAWVLLFPGDFYGGTVTARLAALTPGEYTVVATYFVNKSDETSKFEHPVLQLHDAAPFKIRVLPQGP